MTRVFLDTSVLVAATLSSTGASREILRLAAADQLTIVLSDYVIKEIRNALQRKVPSSLVDFDEFFANTSHETANPTKQEVAAAAAEYTDVKDAPVVAAAINAGADYLASLDKKHLVGQPIVAGKSGLQIVLPGDLLHSLRTSEE